MDLTTTDLLDKLHGNFYTLQPVLSNGKPEVFIYFSPNDEKPGRFVQEDGGVVWFSETFPNGVVCETVCLSCSGLNDLKIELAKKAVERNG